MVTFSVVVASQADTESIAVRKAVVELSGSDRMLKCQGLSGVESRAGAVG
jgi:hypothetical protein